MITLLQAKINYHRASNEERTVTCEWSHVVAVDGCRFKDAPVRVTESLRIITSGKLMECLTALFRCFSQDSAA